MATQEQLRGLELHKKPATQNKYVGIEIEFLLNPKKFKEFKDALADADLSKYVNLGTDGSVEYQDTDKEFKFKYETKMIKDTYLGVTRAVQVCINEDEEPEGHEMRVLVKQDEVEDVLKKIGAIFKKYGAYANSSCGLHVHLDMRNRDPEKCFHNLFQVQDYMFNLQPMYRRTNEYCLKMATKDDDHGHYSGINYADAYAEHKTIEVRIHEGTVDTTAIVMWVKFLTHVCDVRGKIKDKVNSISHFRLPLNVRRYFNARIAKYA